MCAFCHTRVENLLKATDYLNVTDPLITPLSFIFLSCCEKAHDNKVLVVKIQNLIVNHWASERKAFQMKKAQNSITKSKRANKFVDIILKKCKDHIEPKTSVEKLD